MSGEVRELDIRDVSGDVETYGDKGMTNYHIPPASDLVFEIEVLKID